MFHVMSMLSALVMAAGVVWRSSIPYDALAAQQKPTIAKSGNDRRAVLARARVWTRSDIASKNLLVGPADPKAFTFNETVTCTFLDVKLAGGTPKFACRIDPDDEVRVKMGRDNGEVYSEVATTRLLWALGFGAERVYPVRVVCRGCKEKPLDGMKVENGASVFDPAVIKRQAPGEEFTPSGWSWKELDQLDEVPGGATRAERDALKLLAAFIQHSDSKSEQQRLICPGDVTHEKVAECEHPIMYVADVGVTFGRANRWNADDKGSMNLAEWSRTPVWKDRDQCKADIDRSATGTLDNPKISEAGRQFLADLLGQLSDDQLRQMFEAARVQYRLRDPKDDSSGLAAIEEWVAAFKAKREQVVSFRCAPR